MKKEYTVTSTYEPTDRDVLNDIQKTVDKNASRIEWTLAWQFLILLVIGGILGTLIALLD